MNNKKKKVHYKQKKGKNNKPKSEADKYLEKSRKSNARQKLKGTVKSAGMDGKTRRRWQDWRETDGVEYPVSVMKRSEMLEETSKSS